MRSKIFPYLNITFAPIITMLCTVYIKTVTVRVQPLKKNRRQKIAGNINKKIFIHKSDFLLYARNPFYPLCL